VLGFCCSIYLLLAVLTTFTWRHSHDEGVTFKQAIGYIDLAGTAIQPVPIKALNSVLNAESAYSTRDVIAAMETRGMHPPAYYLLVHWWAQAFGTSNLSLRFPAYLFGVLSITGMYRLAERTIPRDGTGYWAGALMGVSPWFISITNYARPYSLAICLAIWSTVCLLVVVSRSARRW